MRQEAEVAAAAPDNSPRLAVRLGRWALADAAKPPSWGTRLIGVVAPLVLFNLDRGLGEGPAYGGVLPCRPYICLLASVSVVCLLIWFKFRDRQHWSLAPLAGAMLLASGTAFGVGLYLLPFSLVAMLAMGIGLLGLIPFWVAKIHLRAGVLAALAARQQLAVGPSLVLGLASALLIALAVFAGGSLAESYADQQMAILLGNRPGDAARAESRLALLYAFPQVRIARLRVAAFEQYQQSVAAKSSAPEGGAITQAFLRVTGRTSLVD